MQTKTLGSALAVLGAVLLIAGALLRFVVAPGLLQLPGDVDETRVYDGTMHTLLNAEALASGNLGELFITDVPVQADRHVAVQETEGGDALVIEEASAMLADGTPIAQTLDTYAVDRQTMEHSSAFADVEGVQAREGLVIGWPIGTEQIDYLGWSDDLQATVPLTFEGEETRDGLTTYVFVSDIAPSPIVDPAILSTLPEALPKAVLLQLAAADPASLPVPAEQFAALAEALPDPVPLTYLYSGVTSYYVEPASGVIIDLVRTETRQAALTVDAAPAPIPIAEVWDWSYAPTAETVADAIDDAESARGQIRLVQTTLPITLVGAGALLIVLGIVLRNRPGRTREDDTAHPTIDIAEDEAKTPVAT